MRGWASLERGKGAVRGNSTYKEGKEGKSTPQFQKACISAPVPSRRHLGYVLEKKEGRGEGGGEKRTERGGLEGTDRYYLRP